MNIKTPNFKYSNYKPLTMTPAEAHKAVQHSIALNKKSNKYPPKVITTYQYWGEVKRIVDADTMDFNVIMGFDTMFSGRFRLIGINTPEIYGVKKTSEEYQKGMAASDFVKTMIQPGDWVEIEIYQGKREKYGRWLCQVFNDGVSINEQLLIHGHAVPM